MTVTLPVVFLYLLTHLYDSRRRPSLAKAGRRNGLKELNLQKIDTFPKDRGKQTKNGIALSKRRGEGMSAFQERDVPGPEEAPLGAEGEEKARYPRGAI